MSIEEKKTGMDPEMEPQGMDGQEMALDDERRVKVLSPGAMVAKRFFRNKLAMVGVVILIIMFIFSYIGGMISPYGESQIFEDYEEVVTDFAGATVNTDYRYTEAYDGSLPSAARTSMILAVNNGESTYEAGENTYVLQEIGDHSYTISGTATVAQADRLAGSYVLSSEAIEVTDDLTAAFNEAMDAGAASFTYDGVEYTITGSGRTYYISAMQELGFATQEIIEASGLSYEAKKEALMALLNNERTFTADGTSYSVEIDGESAVISAGSEEVGIISPYSIQGIENGTVISTELRAAIIEAIENNTTDFTLTDAEGNEVAYEVVRENTRYTIRTASQTRLIQTYLAPSTSHWLGTDGAGMDILTRLMYGGRISLMIGFVVVILETIIGVVLGGLAGYFGKWVDMLIMRIVDIFYCIPTWPILIILGAVMDSYQVDARVRIYFMMVVLAVLGWPFIARIVRGQILSLREQEFMVAAEATGISVSRRIFRHLVPNVIPQLIVQCTMSLGGIILTESTMSFLGIGVKFPYASWGNIISSVSNVFVMTNYWYCWIPAGFCILITVLGFNFVGDGLRDAFDPKMKR